MVALPKPPADKLRLLELGCMAVRVLLEPIVLDMAAASLELVELSGLSMSMLVNDVCSIAMILLLYRRWRFEEEAAGAVVRGSAAAPGPGMAFAGAAAMGTTPFPPTAPLVEPAPLW
jgi:hypothetical protein